MSKGEIHVFIASLRAIHDALVQSKGEIPASVYAELSAMEAYLKRKLDEDPPAR